MQRLLTEDEYQGLVRAPQQFLDQQRAIIQKLCTKIADEVPIKPSWAGEVPPKPWGCILTVEYEHYCDECPAQKMCPHPRKNWSQ